jgi:hypothetical protein
MRSKYGLRNAIAAITALILLGALFGSAQYLPRQGGQLSRDQTGNDPLASPAWDAKRLKALNEDRHKSMVSDTQKLLKLARELDAEIASNPTGKLTSEELHKVAAIEKLAHSVKSKMAQTFTGGPSIQPLGPIIQPGGP